MKKIIFIVSILCLGTGVQAEDVVNSIDELVAESSATSKMTVKELYKGDRYRDPFAELSAGETVSTREEKEFSIETFSIHSLKLKGLMKEKAGNYAIIIDEDTDMGFMLRKSRLFTYQNEKIPGVRGRINMAQQTVTLITDEKDVQVLTLGEEEDEDTAGQE
ncbi:MAG: hypothetical protein COB53_00385 [Elusimicrobia bacterium]|nr:MAG: hypothetical protein COB53_00385 [Elusimicrobiota bacterium]